MCVLVSQKAAPCGYFGLICPPFYPGLLFIELWIFTIPSQSVYFLFWLCKQTCAHIFSCVHMHFGVCMLGPSKLFVSLHVWVSLFVCVKEYITSVCTSSETLIVIGAVETGLWGKKVLCWRGVTGPSFGQAGFGESLIELWIWRTGKLFSHCWGKDGRLYWLWKKMSSFLFSRICDIED